jgi:hypothetical protein
MKALVLFGLLVLGLFVAFLWTLTLLAAFMVVMALLSSVLDWFGRLGAQRPQALAKPASELGKAPTYVADSQ